MTTEKQVSKKTKGKPNDIDMFVGARLRTLRTQRGFSQEALANKIGVTFQQVQKYERGLNRISAGRLWNFAQILDVSIVAFYPAGVSNDTPPEMTVQDSKLMAAITQADEATKKLVRLTVKTCSVQYQRAA